MTQLALNCDHTLHPINQALHDGHSKTRSSGSSSFDRPRLFEFLEYPVVIFWSNANASVYDINQNLPVGVFSHSNGDRAGLRKLDGVSYQILQNRLKSTSVGEVEVAG